MTGHTMTATLHHPMTPLVPTWAPRTRRWLLGGPHQFHPPALNHRDADGHTTPLAALITGHATDQDTTPPLALWASRLLDQPLTHHL